MTYIKIIERKLLNVDEKICSLFDEIYSHDRLWVSNVVLQFLRTFVEHVAARIYADEHPDKKVIIGQTRIGQYNEYVKNCGKYPFIKELLESLNKSVSHFVPEGDGAERLMLMYYANLLKIKKLLKDRFALVVLHNIKNFPTDMDKSLDDYYVEISKKLFILNFYSPDIPNIRYYVLKQHPIVVGENVFYEITLSLARGNVNKVDRFVVFSKEKIKENYSIQACFLKDNINVNGFEMPVQFLLSWRISIRPCELEKIASLCGYDVQISSGSKLYLSIMNYLNISGDSLLEVLELSGNDYEEWKNKVNLNTKTELVESFGRLRDIVSQEKPGTNIIRYLLCYLRNNVINDQLAEQPNNWLSNLYLDNGSIPFDNMPFATSLRKHNVHAAHLFKCLNTGNREHEFLANRVNKAAYENNLLYMDVEDEEMEYFKLLIDLFNNKLYSSEGQQKRKIGTFGKTLCINYYVQETKEIIMKLKEYIGSGMDSYQEDMNAWLEKHSEIDDKTKVLILKNIFMNSKLGLIYGAAGTGKTRVVEYIADFFHDKNMLFLANTHPAVDNLRRRTHDKHNYSTIYSYLKNPNYDHYDLIVIDECSMVSNKDIYKILCRDNAETLLLVGDVYQIESIEFGNWFNFARYFLDKTAVYELTTPYRAKDNKNLIEIWNSVRNFDEHMFFKMQNQNCITDLGEDIFTQIFPDEIVLCLGYSGIYGINNINRFLQNRNPFVAVEWGVWTYKIGDPILFTETHRFSKLLYNNLKGRIVGIEKFEEYIKFTLEIYKRYEEEDLLPYDIVLEGQSVNGNSIISFCVDKRKERDDDGDNEREIVPFQIAYAVSIHKAQGLEYDSVKVVITKDVEERITHSIFYTAITRAKRSLKVYMSSEIQSILVERFIKDNTGLMQAQKFAGNTGLRIKNRLSN